MCEYRFDMVAYVQTERLKRLNEIMHDFGFDGDVGIEGTIGHYTIKIPGDDNLPLELLAKMRLTLEESSQKILAERNEKDIRIQIKEGVKV